MSFWLWELIVRRRCQLLKHQLPTIETANDMDCIEVLFYSHLQLNKFLDESFNHGLILYEDRHLCATESEHKNEPKMDKIV